MEHTQIYVFENRKKIFPIDSRYRFVLLTLRNAAGPDTFDAGFYLHNLQSLYKSGTEADKFHTLSKKIIRKISPDRLHIPEIGGSYLKVVVKMSDGKTLSSESKYGWSVALSSGFHGAKDADLFNDEGRGWLVLQGKNIHQFNPILQRQSLLLMYPLDCQERNENEYTKVNPGHSITHTD